MPCREDHSEDERHERTKLEAMLCAICTAIEHGGNDKDFTPLYVILNSVNWEEAGVTRKDFESWWEEHKARDRARREREEKKRKHDALIASAKAKLTPEEFTALEKRTMLPW